MKKYLYTGFADRFYPDIVIPGEGSLVAHPGDIREFVTPPGDGLWIPAVAPAKPSKAKD